MNIKRADDKPLTIHTKEKAKLHTHEHKRAYIKAANIYTVDRSPKIKGVQAKDAGGENGGHGKKAAVIPVKKGYRKSTFHTATKENTSLTGRVLSAYRQSKQSIKRSGKSVKQTCAGGAGAALDQMEGGNEVREAAKIADTMAKPVTGSLSAGAELFRRQERERKKNQIKKRDAEKRIAKKAAKDTAKRAVSELAKEAEKKAVKEGVKFAVKTGAAAAGTAAGAETGPYAVLVGMAAGKAVGDKLDKWDMHNNSRNRKIRFFLDKMKEEEKQQDSVLKMLVDLSANKAAFTVKKVVSVVGAVLLMLALMLSIAVFPVIAVVAVLYNSPFALFMPPLEAGDTVRDVASGYIADFTNTVNTIARNHTGYDDGHVVYVDYEGISPDNLNDVIVVYMVKYGVGDTATVMNALSKSRLKGVVGDMCTYTKSVKTETVDLGNGSTDTEEVLYVKVTLKSCYDMVTAYHFNAEQKQLVEEMMRMLQETGGGQMQEALTDEEINGILAGITDSTQRAAVAFALSKVGYPYSQQYRDTGSYFDCSSLAYYAWKAAGKDISFNGSNSAAAEAEGLATAGKEVDYSEIQPGDLIFYSYERNGRYLDISHVAVYAGGGMVVEAKGAEYGVTYNAVPSVGNIVLVGRP